ncbi:MAG: DUF5717 family protein [Eubacteriales bacterium]|nr:DUF5717 family protein [Eubacteriales bacterium]
MLEKINLLANGDALKEGESFSSNIKSIKETLNFNKTYKGSFVITSIDDKMCKGIIYSSTHRVKMLQNTFYSQNIEIFYIVDTNGLHSKDIIEGKITILGDGTEIDIPFYFNIDFSDDLKIIDFFFTKENFFNFFLKDPSKALFLFNSKEFIKAPFMNDDILQTYYSALQKCENKQFAIKEFFIILGIDVSIINASNVYKDDILIKEEKEFSIDIDKKYGDLYLEKLEDYELIEQVSMLFIRAGIKNELSFKFYEKSIQNHSNIIKLFDYYVLSATPKYNQTFVKEVYLYFANQKDIPYDIKFALFINIAKNFAKTSDIFKMYESKMKELVLDLLLKNRIDDEIAILYDKILTKEMIDENIARLLIYMLRYFKVEVLGSDIKNIIIRYREINGESIFPVYNGVAYTTIFFDSFEMLFEDQNGNRYVNRNNRIKPMLDRQDLEEVCFNIAPMEDVLKFAKLRTILSDGIKDKSSFLFSIEALKELSLSLISSEKIKNLILDFILNNVSKEEELDLHINQYISSIDYKILNKKQLNLMLKILIKMNKLYDAFLFINEYNYLYFDIADLKQVSLFLIEEINNNNFNINITNHINIEKNENEDSNSIIEEKYKEYLLEMSFFLVVKGVIDKRIVEFLINTYDKDTKNMYYLFQIANDLFIESSIISKNLLTKYLLIDEINNLDIVYNIFNKYPQENDILTRAYLTKKCIGYFLYERILPNECIIILEQIVFNNLKNIYQIPKIFIFSLSKYLSTKDSIDIDERRALIILTEKMLNDRTIFAFLKDLYKFVDMKEELVNAEYIEYHALPGEIPKAYISINEESEIEIELYHIYKNIYSRPISIFKNEKITYKIYNINKVDDGVLKEGTFIFDPVRNDAYVSPNNIKSTYKYINDSIDLLEKKEYQKLKYLVKDMIIREGMISNLFNI